MTTFDCVIVGAGPAGASAAYHLAKAGQSVVILERETLPRYKPCGGGVSPQVAQWFDFDFSPVISARVKRIRYTWKLEQAVETELQLDEPLWMVRREVFDHFLVQQAQKQGAQLWDQTKATGIEFQRDRWQIQTNREPVIGLYLIAADGARGPMAKWLGFGQRQYSMGGAIEVEPKVEVPQEPVAHFEFGLLKNGYVWNFPKVDGYSLGSGAFRAKQGQKYDLRPALADYAASFGVELKQQQKHGHPLLIWQADQTLHTQHAVLAGEAACVVDPFTAEGIRPAMFSGVKAAQAVTQALAGDHNALADYTKTMTEEWGNQMRWAKRLAQAFYTAPSLAYQLGVKNPRSTAAMVRLFCGELSYEEVTQRAFKRLGMGWLAKR
ncbi:MAG: geranylgeranyl reductase family protein [Cyanobacteria bacterium P01_H01_bin.121]